MNEIRLWLDDLREMPPEYTIWVKTAQEAIDILKTGKVVSASLDHDLGEGNGTGYDVAKFIEREAANLPPIKLQIHSCNPVGIQNMKVALQNAINIWFN